MRDEGKEEVGLLLSLGTSYITFPFSFSSPIKRKKYFQVLLHGVRGVCTGVK
jgi:hypothetical protein